MHVVVALLVHQDSLIKVPKVGNWVSALLFCVVLYCLGTKNLGKHTSVLTWKVSLYSGVTCNMIVTGIPFC